MRRLPKFRGDLEWVHQWEGHRGRPYWPGGASGITLDAGFDLGYADPDLFKEAYADVLSPAEIDTCLAYLGVRGTEAREYLANDPTLRSIRVSEEEAATVFPYVAESYWLNIAERFSTLSSAPGPVQTALLSLSINRGPGNRDLSVLRKPLAREDWDGLASRIRRMQDDHPLRGIQIRRDEEAELIEKAAQLRQKKLERIATSVRKLELTPTEELPTTRLSSLIKDLELQ
jgi:GH24 family phage-related lysozyme (muramidase)